MTQYLLSVHSVDGEVRRPMTDEEMQQSWKQIQLLNQELKSAGAWVFSGRLHDPDTATVVRMADGEVVTTDGPFVESREHLGGFYIIQARGSGCRAGLGVQGHRSGREADRGLAVRRHRGLTAWATATPQPPSTRSRSPDLPRGVRPIRGHPDPRRW